MSKASGGASESVEVERKYEVDAATKLPGSEAFAAAGFAATEPQVVKLTATYFDTSDRALATAGAAVRQRVGGHDAGWHIKERLEGGEVRETTWPPSKEAPAALFDKLESILGWPPMLQPLAEMNTERTIVMLSVDGRNVIEIADDTVLGIDHAREVSRAWREWEAELLPGADPALLDALEPVLLSAGATQSLSFAKIARATGQLVAVARRAGASDEVIEQLKALDASDQAAARRLES